MCHRRRCSPRATPLHGPAFRGSGGQAVPILAVALLLAALVGVGLAHVAAAASQRAAAQAAADATALAGAEEGREAAVEVARANGAELVHFVQDHIDVEVTISRSGITATARARWLPRHYIP